MSIPLKDQAIKSALENNWNDAYKINFRLLEENPEDIDTLNRLAFSLIKLSKFKQAKDAYQKVIQLDKTNPIATKNLKKLETMSKQKGSKKSLSADTTNANTSMPLDELFIEETGKTKTVELKNVADKKSLSLLQPGDLVCLAVKRSKIFIQSYDKKYIGMLPDSIGMRLITFIKGGNEYQACIKALTEKTVIVFIKESKKMSKFKNQQSFTATPFILSTSSIND
ncbi:MAG: hypothetical protein COX79_05045 [Candidatus Levybacteria bacterium CG_4_10_14_0_2_um_filter_36_16]|nr:MAG: hypothetical protein AUK12_04165 [Candidatus Levybacteria bacterium CG2_30_37_29]PIR78780.1 MAG: hypothetical protein COU26_04745 [Candidatus Levybacteria bacterium CG10_big_fil_rev_8_21_14_0_10_36_30]PIZ96496.1 MAG: hypothetical protein COX79_05045 [Candidatus Levybacteria bacterium CG_4_10_14_0_2_um_filter_36_16]PJA90782.1 MAG: hypothetical protein CO136_00625 [Candidatus Levybacteria bacterium CG_4_9_14_3_um_filter_36_7]